TTDQQFYALGDPLRVTAHTRGSQPAALRVELWDNRNRLIGTETVKQTQSPDGILHAALKVGNYSTNIGWVRATLLEDHEGQEIKMDQKQSRVNFVSLDRKFGAYELILPWYGPPSYEPWNPALLSQFRKMGVTVVENPRDNFKIISEVRAPGFGVYWHYRRNYVEQKDNYLRSHDTQYLIRQPDLSSHAWLDTLRGDIITSVQKHMPYRPLAYYLADESSLTAYSDPLDFSWSRPTLEALRQWLKGQYSSLDALNKEWETDFKTWDEVMPLTTEQAQAKGDYAGWMDHRTFMEQVFAHAVDVAAETVKAEDPGGLPSISGTQAPGPSNAVNWYLLDYLVGYLQPYSNDDQDDLHRSIHAHQILTGFTGYGNAGVKLRHQLWHRLFHGQTGASVFWQYTALNSDLTLTQQGRDLEAVTNEFRNEGLALLLRDAQRENCGIAVHYSLLSVRGHWIADGHIHPGEVTNGDATSANLKRFHQNRTQWLQLLRDAGYQYDFLTTEQIDKGNLSNYRVLVLPDSIALSEGEVTAIRSFVERGGLLISDGETGLMDGHARWQNQGLLDKVLGVQQGAMTSEPTTAAAMELHATLNSKPVDLDVIPANPGLGVTSGHAAATSGGTPFLVEHSLGAGRAVTFNFWLTQYDKSRKAGTNGPLLSLIEDYLSQSGISPVADVHTASGKALRCSEVTGYRKGDVRYLAVLPGLGCADAGPVVLRLPEAEYVYDLRAHRLIGHVATVHGNLMDGEPWFLALSPDPAPKLSIRAGASSGGQAQVKAGAAIAFDIRLAGAAAFCTFPEAVHVDVSDPSGKTIGYYGDNLPLENCGARFSVATALNDAPGQWKVSVREPYTHQIVAAAFTVVPR
ncbi:MAG: beta-galactosidase trimerization domain-containing protein, partial [Terriglobia bacterium]